VNTDIIIGTILSRLFKYYMQPANAQKQSKEKFTISLTTSSLILYLVPLGSEKAKSQFFVSLTHTTGVSLT
jgi:hypothetical protein